MRYVLAALLLAGCAGGYQPDPDRSAAIRATFAEQVALYNAAGIDPLQLDPEERMYAALACATLTSISTVIDPTAVTLPDDAGAWCLELTKALAPAVPVVPPPAKETEP